MALSTPSVRAVTDKDGEPVAITWLAAIRIETRIVESIRVALAAADSLYEAIIVGRALSGAKPRRARRQRSRPRAWASRPRIEPSEMARVRAASW
jgi:hypothetical protein